ncbi:sce7726 family protein [Sphingobacterium sp. SRCM116780]|uniref:sce7726 family protein n=1 Tax=Sphingobacterium sp. SRCM116780 TaxID=2907623 RepID=UPI001F3A1DC1|nr:sce7726 family protein [Sphingobacterium sp. SRCM116780]UIR54772.1 sce7726 family protein [Sphingobacterium sp. SRCM116780]
MQPCPTYDKAQLRELASLVSHAAFKKLGNSTNQSTYIRRMKKSIGWDNTETAKPRCLSDLISYSYQILEQQYRHEYIYKNKLLNDFVMEYYAMDDTILLNEFRIGQSIADAVLINGTNKVFEIKTELDTPERLESQLNDYYKAFTEVYLFTHISLLDKYLSILPNYVGVLIYTEEGEVAQFRPAINNKEFLDASFMMASLRKPEYSRLVKELVGFLPEVTPVFYYRACLTVLNELPIEDVQSMYCHILKNRIDKQTNMYLTQGDLPSFVNFSFYQAKYNKKAYLTMINNLSKNLL